jgi:hypothetical protein
MMNPQKQITTNAPSIRYEGDLRAEQAGIMQKHAQAMQQMQQQNMMQQQQQQQGMMQPQMGQPQMPQGRMPAAYGGIMDTFNRPNMAEIAGPSDTDNAMDSLFNHKEYMELLIDQMLKQGLSQEEMIEQLNMMQEKPQMPQQQMPQQDPRQMAAYGGIMGVDGRKQYGIGSWFQEKIMDPIKNNKVLAAAAAGIGANYFDLIPGDKSSKGWLGSIMDPVTKQLKKIGDIETGTGKTVSSDIMGGLSKALIPAAGGLVAGMFSDKLNPADEQGNIDYGSGIGLSNIAKSANLLDQKQGIQAGLRFLPKVSARQYTPEEMAVQYSSTPATLAGGGIAELGIPNYGQQMMDPNMMEQIKMMVESMQAQGMSKEEMEQAVRMQVPDMSADMSMGYAEGGPLGEMGTVMEEGEEMLDMNGMEKDYREDGGFVPIGEYEKKDDVPARLSVNEFVFTADAVRGAGDGDVDKGAERLQGIMKQLEQQGRPEGMGMLNVSERLSEVV